MRPSPTLAAVVALALSAPGAHAQAAPRRLVLVPEAAITAGDGPAAAVDVADVAIGRDETVYVAQERGHVVLALFADGRPPRTLGRAGRGPGEFAQGPRAVGWRGDTLVAADSYGRRLVGFLGDGRPAFTRAYEGIEKFLPRALLADGRTLGERLTYSRDIVAGRETAQELLTAGSPAGPARTMARLPLRHRDAQVIVGSGRGRSEVYFTQPYADADLFDVDPMGRWVVSVAGPAVTGSQRAVFTLSWRSPDGVVRRTATVAYVPARLHAAAARETRTFYTDMLAKSFTGEPRGRMEALVRDAICVPNYYPPATAVVSGNDGTTWVRRGGPGDTVTWMVFDARGTHVAWVTAPTSVTLHAATATHAWGVTMNGDDVPIVTRYALRPRPGRSSR